MMIVNRAGRVNLRQRKMVTQNGMMSLNFSFLQTRGASMRTTAFLWWAVWLFAASSASALEIDIGHHVVVPNMPGQKIGIYATGGELVNGISLSVAINGGGKAHGGKPGPLITNIDVDAGPTIWNQPPGHNPPSVFNDGQLWNVNFLTTGGYVSADGLVATVTVDTTGYFGRHTLELSGGGITESVGDTQFQGQDLELTIVNGTFGDATGDPDE